MGECGLDLRINFENPPSPKPETRPKEKGKIIGIIVHKKKKRKTANADAKYLRYLNKYWICELCSFWNPNKSQKCMVCSMLNMNDLHRTKETKIKLNSEPIQAKVTVDLKAATWVDMYKNKAVVATETKAKCVPAPVIKKKNAFGWICNKCTFENKPANQKCVMCSDPKPRKIKNKKRKNEKKEDKDDEKKWSIAGNKECPCGSGRKFKKCCKKLQKHQPQRQSKNYDDYRDEYEHDAADMDMIHRLSEAIERIEHRIDHFKGRKGDKMKIIKELNKARNKRDELHNKMKRDRNEAIKRKNRQNRDREWTNVRVRNGHCDDRPSRINKAVVAKTIAI